MAINIFNNENHLKKCFIDNLKSQFEFHRLDFYFFGFYQTNNFKNKIFVN